MEENQNNRKEILNETIERLRDVDSLGEVEDLIKNNTIEFEFNGLWYRIRKPNRQERHEIKTVKHRRFMELLKDSGNVVEEELIKVLYSRGVDIVKMRQDVNQLQQKIDQLSIRLTESLIPKDRDVLRKEIQSILHDRVLLQYEIDGHLSCCIEKQIKDFVQEYIIFIVLETKTDSGWQRYFKSYEDFMKSTDENEDGLIYRATYYLAAMLSYEK